MSDTIAFQRDQAKRELAAAEAGMADLAERMKPYNATYSRLQSDIAKAKNKLRELEKQPRVSDHAVIRYLERKHGFCFDDTRNEILTDDIISAINMGCKSIKRDGITMKVKDKCITTVLE